MQSSATVSRLCFNGMWWLLSVGLLDYGVWLLLSVLMVQSVSGKPGRTLHTVKRCACTLAGPVHGHTITTSSLMHVLGCLVPLIAHACAPCMPATSTTHSVLEPFVSAC